MRAKSSAGAKQAIAVMLLGFATLSGAQAEAARRGPPAFDWTTFEVPDFGTTVEYPAGVFTVTDGKAEKGVGERLRTADGRALLTIYARANEAGETPAVYLRNNLRQPRSDLDYERVTRSFFAISSVREGTIYYSRCNFSSDGAIHCFDLAYPRQERRAWDPLVTRISRSLRPLEG